MNSNHPSIEHFRDAQPSTGIVVAGCAAGVLDALAAPLHGVFRCAYLDPPYNTGRPRPGYSDRVPHEQWEAALEQVVRALRPSLTADAVVFVQVDDNVQGYVQVLLDRVFGRSARLATIVVKMSELSGLKMRTADRRPPRTKELLFAYANSSASRLGAVIRRKDDVGGYTKYYNHVIENPADPVESWRVVRIRDFLAQRGVDPTPANIDDFRITEASRVVYRTNNRLLSALRFETPTASVVSPTGVHYIWWEGRQMLFLADRLVERLGDLWLDISTINLGKEGGVPFRGSKKPEALLRRVIEMSTNRGDAVLDPYGGSGTTAAVAHKLGRRWLTIESSPPNAALIRDRLDRVVSGADPSGISSMANWRGGGQYTIIETVGPEADPAWSPIP